MEQFHLNLCCHHHFKNGLCETPLFAHVLEVLCANKRATLYAHLNALHGAGAHPLRGVCWHFMHVLLDTETQLLQAAGLVAVSSRLLALHSPELKPAGLLLLGSLQAQHLPQQAR